MKLWEINEALEDAFWQSVDPETGEITDSTLLDELRIERDEKVENIALLIKDMKAEASAIQEEERKLRARRTACEHQSEWLKDYLQKCLAGEKFKTSKVSISYRKSESVEVANVWDLTDDYMKFKDPEPDKVRIKEDIKKGIHVVGAELVEKTNMIIK